MGSCSNCGKTIILREKETTCDSCGAEIGYSCHECKTHFLVKDLPEEGKACQICHWYYCPSCGICGDNCRKRDWMLYLIKNHPTLSREGRSKIIRFMGDASNTKEMRSCPENVPITYGKIRNKLLKAYTEGYRKKKGEDSELFMERMEKAMGFPIGKEVTVESVREAGFYGQEYRDALNYCVCLGHFKITWKKNNKDENMAVFTRVDGKPCRFLNKEAMYVAKCKKCKRSFHNVLDNCPTCTYQRRSKHHTKGEPVKTTKKLSNIEVCNLSTKHFKKNGSGYNTTN